MTDPYIFVLNPATCVGWSLFVFLRASSMSSSGSIPEAKRACTHRDDNQWGHNSWSTGSDSAWKQGSWADKAHWNYGWKAWENRWGNKSWSTWIDSDWRQGRTILQSIEDSLEIETKVRKLVKQVADCENVHLSAEVKAHELEVVATDFTMIYRRHVSWP